MKTVALVPSYEPDNRLLEVVDELAAQGLDVVVVDDGSGFGYSELFACAAEKATVIGYINNVGKGAALKVGLDHILKTYPADTIVVTVDGDGQHAVADVLACSEAARVNRGSLVIGARSFAASGVPLRSRAGNVITRGIFCATSGVRVTDTQTGLRAFSIPLARKFAEIGGERFEYEMNVLYACAEWDVPIFEVPIQAIYHNGNKTSHFHVLRDSALIYRSILEYVGASFVSFVCDYLMFALLAALLLPFGQLGVVVSNVCARLVSATLNFTLNRVVVFKSTESLYTTAVRYALLATSILVINTCAIAFLTGVAHIPALIAKLIVECALFVFSWVAQNRAVFVRKERVYA